MLCRKAAGISLFGRYLPFLARDVHVLGHEHDQQIAPKSNGRRLPKGLGQRVFAWVQQRAQAPSAPFDRWQGHRVVLADGTCVSMADQPELKKAFGVNASRHGAGRYPLARVVTLCLAGTRVILSYAIGPYHQGEMALTFPLLHQLSKGDLFIADRHS